MADKRTTPEAAEGAQADAPAEPRRKKRAAPTIDLTATEMPPPQPDPPPAEPAPDAPAAAESRPAGSVNMPILAAGACGGAIVALLLFALWFADLLPARSTASSDSGAQVAALQAQLRDLQNRPAAAVDDKAAAALGQRVNKIEDAIARLPAGDTGVSERLAAADNAMKSLGVALAALNRRGDDISASLGQARERADAAAKAVTDLSARVQDIARNGQTAVSSAEFDALQKRIAALEQAASAARAEIAKASSADVAARLALSAAALRDAASSGAPFATELAQARALGADEKTLAPLAPFAASGVPTPAALAQELHALLPAILKASGARAPAGGFLERLEANAGRLVRVRPVDAPAGDDASAVLARLEVATARNDIAAALADLGKLPAAARAPAQGWIAKAQARQAALVAARQFAADTARALGPR